MKPRARKPDRPRVLLVVTDAGGAPGTSPFMVRLRRALKCLLRSFGVRCVMAQVADDRQGQDDSADPPRQQPGRSDA